MEAIWAFLKSLSVPEVDVIAHSMGGLIVRSYLSGLQTSGAFSPPPTPRIRKAVFLGTPHFGSFLADNPLADILFFAGNQTNEMKRGSQFLWNLSTWNQFGDGLRGTDALAVIGNAGSYGNTANTSDGVVATTSGSLAFAEAGKTRVVNYCHIPLNPGSSETTPSCAAPVSSLESALIGCEGPGLACVDTPTHDSGCWRFSRDV